MFDKRYLIGGHRSPIFTTPPLKACCLHFVEAPGKRGVGGNENASTTETLKLLFASTLASNRVFLHFSSYDTLEGLVHLTLTHNTVFLGGPTSPNQRSPPRVCTGVLHLSSAAHFKELLLCFSGFRGWGGCHSEKTKYFTVGDSNSTNRGCLGEKDSLHRFMCVCTIHSHNSSHPYPRGTVEDLVK